MIWYYIQELSNKLKDTEKVKKALSMELEKLYQVTIHYTILAAVSVSQLYLTTYTYLLNNFSGAERATSRERT